MFAVAIGRAWKDGADFKWRATSIAKHASSLNNDSNHLLKGEYSLYYGVLNTRVFIHIIREDLVNVDANLYGFSYTDNYEGVMGAVIAVQSSEPFTIQNAMTEAYNISATSHITGKSVSDNDPNTTFTHEASADLPYCDCTEGNDDEGAHNSSPSTTPSGASISPSEGSYSASSGGTHSASLSVPSGFSSVYWYVASPSDTGLGTNVETDTGTGSTTSASFSWSIPSDASGDYVITAYTYLTDNSIVQPSYTVSVSSSTSLFILHTCLFYVSNDNNVCYQHKHGY